MTFPARTYPGALGILGLKTTKFPAAIFLRTRFILGTLADVRKQPCEAADIKRSCASRAFPPSKHPRPYTQTCVCDSRHHVQLCPRPAAGSRCSRCCCMYTLNGFSHELQKALAHLAPAHQRACSANQCQETPLKRSVIQQRRGLAIHEYRSAALLESVRVLR